MKLRQRQAIAKAILSHGDQLQPCGEYLLPKLVKAWAAYMQKEHPELKYVLPILLEDQRLGYRWDPSRKEEPPCEIAKGLLGRLVAMGLCNAGELMKGEYDGCLAAAVECGTCPDTDTPTKIAGAC